MIHVMLRQSRRLPSTLYHCDVSLEVIEKGDQMKHTITSITLLISLGRKIVGNVGNNVGTQAKKIYNCQSIFRHFKAEILHIFNSRSSRGLPQWMVFAQFRDSEASWLLWTQNLA